MTKQEILRLLKARLMEIRKSRATEKAKKERMQLCIEWRTRDRCTFSAEEVWALVDEIPEFLAGYVPQSASYPRDQRVQVMTTRARKAWAAKQPGGMSATIDRLIATEMAKENESNE